MGFDIGEEICYANMALILDKAKAYGTFVRLDMESSAYTQRTLDFFTQRLFPKWGAYTGVVIQSCLRRSESDIASLIALKARVRLCKGAYLEPAAVAFPDKADVYRTYLPLMEGLLTDGNYPGLATHDERIVGQARDFARAHGIGPERFEFQMLYGIRRDLQEQLRGEGFNVRVYIPFGTQWYPISCASGGTPGQRRLHSRECHAGDAIGSLVEVTLGGYMESTSGRGLSVAMAMPIRWRCTSTRPDEAGRRCRDPLRALVLRWRPSGPVMWRPTTGLGPHPDKRNSGCAPSPSLM
jgi:proline dehydrogenase